MSLNLLTFLCVLISGSFAAFGVARDHALMAALNGFAAGLNSMVLLRKFLDEPTEVLGRDPE